MSSKKDKKNNKTQRDFSDTIGVFGVAAPVVGPVAAIGARLLARIILTPTTPCPPYKS